MCGGNIRHKTEQAVRNWTTKEAKLVLEWARGPAEERTHVDEVATRLNRSARAVQEFLRRVLPEGQRPWAEKPRWSESEISALRFDGGSPATRSAPAIRQYVTRHHCVAAKDCEEE